ncbi:MULTISPECIES: redox-sensitive transcriptional activator SoxR [unclassified Sphingopyxis]|jgi:MerR family transcriptional regulator, redox-sensitive transcriptional activator SoxR|uniref:redox-sensitive transcriptional activator SoxR n=1 Tax=unclassified Sphingopyxis TaxID=2614943 RepID=UPI0028660C36|nr:MULTISPECIES: redox-sensitive transcriptional activator SoxR [unclassified Sphingopyxis]MDR6834301.1 MerR family redox-sensitive transcriptional activator SoxR [Sphingopyxis sp. BE122]MDR7226570.1 MerR family redox-sensitive transcriptional activator SoxR [Sphingopyxis sp. BE259]
MHRTDLIAIGELSARTGVAVSAIRFYEAKGLVEALRTGGGQRRFLRADIRRVSFILIAQQLGLSLGEIAAELGRLPAGRTPNGADWTRISTALRARIDGQIAALERTRALLGNCIGCGCLSLKKCGLYNPQDKAAQRGAGPRYVMGDRAGEIAEVG